MSRKILVFFKGNLCKLCRDFKYVYTYICLIFVSSCYIFIYFIFALFKFVFPVNFIEKFFDNIYGATCRTVKLCLDIIYSIQPHILRTTHITCGHYCARNSLTTKLCFKLLDLSDNLIRRETNRFT